MSPRNFARPFKHELGITPGKYVEQVRIEAAKGRIAESARSVKEVAVICGFQTVEFFRRSFARHTGINPLAYRARFRSNGPQHAPAHHCFVREQLEWFDRTSARIRKHLRPFLEWGWSRSTWPAPARGDHL
jgi:hypothetical protein